MEEFLSKDGSVTILLFCFLLTLNIVFHILGFWKSYREYSRKKEKGRLNVIEIEYIGISTVLFVCKNRTKKNHDSVNRPLIGIQALLTNRGEGPASAYQIIRG